MGHRADSAGRCRHAIDRHRRLGLGRLRAAIPERQRAAIEFILDIEAPANAARISEGTGRLPVRRSVYRDFPTSARSSGTAFFGRHARGRPARPAVPIYNAISRELQLAIGYCHRGDADT